MTLPYWENTEYIIFFKTSVLSLSLMLFMYRVWVGKISIAEIHFCLMLLRPQKIPKASLQSDTAEMDKFHKRSQRQRKYRPIVIIVIVKLSHVSSRQYITKSKYRECDVAVAVCFKYMAPQSTMDI